MDCQNKPNVVVAEKRVLSLMVNYSKGGIQVLPLVKKQTGTMKLFAFDDGERLKEHTAPHDAYLFILEGEAVVTIEEQTFQLQAGDMIILPATRTHAVKAKTRFKMLLIMFGG